MYPTHLLHTLELNLMATKHPDWAAEREQAVRAYPRGLKRLAIIGLNNLVVASPEKAEHIIGRIAGRKGFSFVGMGVDSFVYRTVGSSVVNKVHVTTSLKSPDQQQHEAGFRNDEFGMLQYFLGNAVLPQKTLIDVHPVTQRNPLVQTEQTHCEIEDDISYYTPCSGVLSVLTGIERTRRKLPEAGEMVYDFVQGARDMYCETDFLPDTNGPANLVFGRVEDGATNLFLLDGKPVGPAHEQVQQRILEQLDALERSLK